MRQKGRSTNPACLLDGGTWAGRGPLQKRDRVGGGGRTSNAAGDEKLDVVFETRRERPEHAASVTITQDNLRNGDGGRFLCSSRPKNLPSSCREQGTPECQQEKQLVRLREKKPQSMMGARGKGDLNGFHVGPGSPGRMFDKGTVFRRGAKEWAKT